MAEPSGDGGYLKPMPELEGDSASYNAHHWWRIKATPDAVMTYVKRHAPAGSRVFETGSASNGRTGTHSEMVGYSWPTVPGVLGDREVQVTVTALPGAVTGVLAESQSDWVVPRPAAERIPNSVKQVAITAQVPGHPSMTIRTRNPTKVNQLVALFNSMPIVQPITINCPALIGGGQHLTFNFEDTTGRPLAVASFTEFPNLGKVSGECTPIQLTIGGRAQHPLAGGRFIPPVDEILRAHF